MIVFEEDCINGVPLPTPRVCPTLQLFLQLQRQASSSADTLLNVFDSGTALQSAFTAAPGFEAVFGNQIGGFFKSIALPNPTDERVAVLKFNTLHVDVTNASNISFIVPFQLFQNREPPLRGNKPLVIQVRPSPARVTNFTERDLKQSSIWTGGFQFNITLQGETWDQEATRATFVDATKVAYTDGNLNLLTWPTLKYDIVPPSALSFPLPNVLTVTFVQNVDYQLNKTEAETITFQLTADMMASKTEPRSTIGAVVNVTVVKPTLVVLGSKTFHERDVKAGAVRFTLTLAGERWRTDDFTALCGSKFVWTSDAVLPDDHGWNDAEIQRQLMDGAIGIPLVRNLVIQWRNVSDYDIVRAETISIRVPKECMSGDWDSPPEGAPTIVIEPQAAKVTTYFVDTAQVAATAANPASLYEKRLPVPLESHSTWYSDVHPQLSGERLPTVTESRVRSGDVSLVFDLREDRFNVSALQLSLAAMQEQLVTSMAARGVDAQGWDQTRLNVVDLPNLQLRLDGAQLIVPINFYAEFGVSETERVQLSPDPLWMRSEVSPEDAMAFFIVASPGLVTVSGWTGQNTGATVSEDIVRNGQLQFDLRLLGDSWSSDRAAYSASLSAIVTAPERPQPTGIEGARLEAIPGMEFWRFGSTGGYATLGVTFQRAESYDIAKPEVVRIQLDNRTVSSRLSPSWLYLGAETPSFTFTVQPSPGTLLLSGNIHKVTEHDLREQAIVVRLMLIGETFVTTPLANVTALIIQSIVSDDRAFAATRDQLLAPTATSVSVVRDELVLRFGPLRSYALASTLDSDRVQIRMPKSLFQSGLLPLFTSPFVDDAMASSATDAGMLTIPLFKVNPSGGGIRVVLVGSNASGDGRTVTVPESALAPLSSSPLLLELALDGDTWDVVAVRAKPGLFLSGFRSTTPMTTEPHGFSRYAYDILQLGTPGAAIRIMSANTVRVALCGACPGVHYDLSDKDQVIFALPSAEFVNKKVSPTPASLEITVQASLTWVTADLRSDARQDPLLERGTDSSAVQNEPGQVPHRTPHADRRAQ
jgi:hypothetical protein